MDDRKVETLVVVKLETAETEVELSAGKLGFLDIPSLLHLLTHVQ